MRITNIPTFKVLGIILVAIFITLLFLAAMHEAPILLASVGWHGIAKVS